MSDRKDTRPTLPDTVIKRGADTTATHGTRTR